MRGTVKITIIMSVIKGSELDSALLFTIQFTSELSMSFSCKSEIMRR